MYKSINLKSRNEQIIYLVLLKDWIEKKKHEGVYIFKLQYVVHYFQKVVIFVLFLLSDTAPKNDGFRCLVYLVGRK